MLLIAGPKGVGVQQAGCDWLKPYAMLSNPARVLAPLSELRKIGSEVMPDFYDQLEIQAPEAREQSLLESLAGHIAHAMSGAPGWAKHLAGVDAAAITSRETLASLPVLRKTDLSPDGEYLLLLAANYSRKREIQSWTALTRAPFLTAIAFWRWIGTYGGGGLFGGAAAVVAVAGHGDGDGGLHPRRRGSGRCREPCGRDHRKHL